MRLAALALSALIVLSGAAMAETVAEPDGYHGEPYRSPVPATLSGATVVDLAATDALVQHGAVLIDALPRVKRPDNLPAGTIWRGAPHDTIPGAVWLPGTGYQALAAQDEAAFADALAMLSGRDKTKPLVFFCKRDCWMSWNAAKRAVGWGYSAVAWFPGGVDDWAEAGRELEPAKAFAP